jgi:hypothetical protein
MQENQSQDEFLLRAEMDILIFSFRVLFKFFVVNNKDLYKLYKSCRKYCFLTVKRPKFGNGT